ncbi:unnamed protein product [Didymodactylos carnosus]|uniref:Reverse transcriptase domain-containing protein n=1 Tax=Didymodactylos carnosus TaxID=1234261 RepID=A0A8S2QBD3_9BILA|nr:unnamed protein product [Didymodactylos carnosus]CAF4091152.1 unnamed protein product [Didymodactylos carnosus]
MTTNRASPDYRRNVSRSLVTLLRKPGTPEEYIETYRPLSLTNVDYKIISKVLAQRLKLVMEKVVHPDQTCSVPNRTLQDSIHLARSLIRYHRQRREPFGLAQWDQEKAFDRLRSNNRIPGLLPPGANIPSIRQRILPSGIDPTVKVSAYADDITSVVYTPEEEEETLNMFALFNKASGGKTNVSKTEILWVSDWCPPPPFKARVKSDYSIYLGVPIDVSGADLRWKDQLLWSNLMPHIETENELFNEVGRDTRQWLLDGHPIIINTMSQSKSVYWILVEMLFRKPVSLKWIPLECKEVFYRTLHKSKMPARVFDLWYRLSLSGLTTGSRFGRSAEQQQCMFCRDCESQAHLWVQCAYFSPLFTCLKQEVFKRYKIELARKQNDLIYMQPVITSNKTSTKNIMLMIGYYFYVIWSYRNDVKFRYMKRSGKIPLQRFKQLLLQT